MEVASGCFVCFVMVANRYLCFPEKDFLSMSSVASVWPAAGDDFHLFASSGIVC